MESQFVARTATPGVLAGLLLAVVIAGPASGAGMHGGPPPTLQEVVEAAYELHPQRMALDARSAEVDALGTRARSLIADSPALAGGYKTDRIGSNTGYQDWIAGVSVPLWKLGQRRAEKQVAESAASSLDEGRRALLLRVAGEVRERMWETALMQNNLELARKEWETARELENNVKRRVELGELARTDLLLAQDETLTKRAAYLNAQVRVQNAMESYTTFTGLGRLPRKRGEQLSQRTKIVDEHPYLANLSAQVRQAQSAVSAVRSRGGGSPEVFLGGNGEKDNSTSPFNNRIEISLKLPIGLSSHTNPAITAAERTRAEAMADYQDLRRELSISLVQARQDLESIEARFSLAREQNRLARENLRLAKVAFDAGESDFFTLLRVQRLAFAAQRREKELKISRQRAIARYNQTVGVMP